MRVGNYMLKYNFESNSQLVEFYNGLSNVGNYMLKYNFESNSQRYVTNGEQEKGWELYAKVQF